MNLIQVFALLFAMMLGLPGCRTIVDISPAAYASGDLTLVGALSDGPCKSLPVGGADVCRVKEGAPIESIWRLVVPKEAVNGGQVTVYYKDYSRVYPITGPVIDIPFRDIVNADKWAKSHSDVATALAEVKYMDTSGIQQTVRAEGMAIIIVLSANYDPLPMDSGQENWGLNCIVQYSSAGRSALSCK